MLKKKTLGLKFATVEGLTYTGLPKLGATCTLEPGGNHQNHAYFQATIKVSFLKRQCHDNR